MEIRKKETLAVIFLFFALGDLVAAFEMQKIRTGKSRESKTWPAFPSCPAAFISNTSNLWVRNTSRFVPLQKIEKIVREKFTNYYKMLRIVLCFKNAKLSFNFIFLQNVAVTVEVFF